MRTLLLLACLVLHLLSLPADATTKVRVDKILVLLLDSSMSVDGAEWDLQVQGLSDAFHNPSVVDALTGFGTETTAVIAVEFAGMNDQKIVVPWTIIASAYDAQQFAEALSTLPRTFGEVVFSYSGSTAISDALRYSVDLIRDAPIGASYVVIDVSSDGSENSSSIHDLKAARHYALENDIVINALVVLGSGIEKGIDLVDYYENHVIGGPGSFVEAASSYEDYARAIRTKIAREIAVASN